MAQTDSENGIESALEGIVHIGGAPPVFRAVAAPDAMNLGSSDPSGIAATITLTVAVPDAMNLGTSDPAGIAAQVSRTLRRDLELAGYFQVLMPASYFFDQHADGMTAATINFQNWFSVGAQGLAKTSFRVAGNQVRLDFRLYNVDGQEQIELAFEPVTVGFGDVQAQVHEFANQILEYYTGYRGPFGTALAFVGRGQDGSREIYRMTVGGDGVSAVTSNRSINILPEWVGGQIAYTTYVNGNPDLAVGGGDRRRMVSSRPGLNNGGALSPDGSALAVTLSRDGNTEIYLLNPDGSELRRLTNNRAEDVEPCWSPSGDMMAFTSDRSGDRQVWLAPTVGEPSPTGRSGLPVPWGR